MMSRRISISGWVFVEGQWWLIEIEGDAKGDLPEQAIAMAKYAAKAGLKGLPAGASPSDSQGRSRPLVDQPMTESDAIRDATLPTCPDHATPMKISDFNDEGADVTYYCPQRDTSGYCTKKVWSYGGEWHTTKPRPRKRRT